jgi:zinc/manganese transport system substrate-binding protein
MENHMKKILSLALLFILISPALQAKNLRLVAIVPELADIASRIGGQWVHVDTIARGTEDIHQVIMRPSLVPKINSADALIFLGLTIEHSFLPGLLTVSANPQMRADVVKQCLGTGCIDCSEGVAVLQKMANLSRSEGEFHPFGNPHYNLEPDNGVIMARNIAAGLSRIDAAHAADYEKNLREYLAELNAKLIEWRRQVAPLKGLKAVSYHQDVVYLGRLFPSAARSATWPATIPSAPAPRAMMATSSAVALPSSLSSAAFWAAASKAFVNRASPARMARASPKTLWLVGFPRRRSSSSIAGRSS